MWLVLSITDVSLAAGHEDIHGTWPCPVESLRGGVAIADDDPLNPGIHDRRHLIARTSHGGGLPDALRIENVVQGRWQGKVGERRRPRSGRHGVALTPWTRLVAGHRMTLAETVSAT
jgi:hypothetical protein